MSGPLTVKHVFRVAMVVVLLVGCASVSAPPTPITGIGEIEGRWQGTITLGFNGPEELYWITIHFDGSYVAQWGANWQWGKVTVNGGAATFEVTSPGAASGTVKYYAGPGKRTLMFNATFGDWSTYVTPAGRM
jgi:hypothetical protein